MDRKAMINTVRITYHTQTLRAVSTVMFLTHYEDLKAGAR